MPSRAGSLALHVDAAKRLLQELEQHSATALAALGSDDGTEFLAAVDERDRILAQLDVVVDALAHERVKLGSDDDAADETAELLREMARLAASALESHEHLSGKAKAERDRLAALITRTARPDAVASQYAAAKLAPRVATLSVTG